MAKGQNVPQFGSTIPMNRQEAIMKFEKFVQRAGVHYEELSEQTNIARQIIMLLVRDYEQELANIRSDSTIDKKYIKGLEVHIETNMTANTPPAPVRDDFIPKPVCDKCGMEKGHKKDCATQKPQ